MKNVLFATTALVAFAGAAAAEVSFSGDVEVGYYSVGGNAGFYVDGDAEMKGTMDFDYGVSVEVTVGLTIYDGGSDLGVDDFPTVVVTTEWVTLTAGVVESAGADHYSGVDGMGGTTGFFEENGEFMVRADVTFGDISASVSGVATNDQFGGPIDTLSVGASGSFGSISFGVGYDDGAGGEIGANVGVSFGGFDIDLAYQTDGTENSIGVAVGTTFGAVEVDAYYALNSAAAAADAYGVSASGDFGAVTVGAYWDGDAAGASNFGVDLEYAVSEAITAYAGYDEADSFYVGATMDIAEGAAVGFAYADDAGAANSRDVDHGPEDFQDGISVWFSAEF